MDISVTANPSRQAAYINTQTNAAQRAKKAGMSAPAQAQDEIVISPEAKTTMEQTAQVGTTAPTAADAEKQTSNTITFASFAEEFSKITQGYGDNIRKYYAEAHDDNLTYDDPAAHIWDKYKNPDSPDFRADLSEDERAWAYDQELDLLSGGKHLQMSNPYAFASAGGLPTLASAAIQANQACREQIDQSIQDLLAENGIELPADASFRLTVDQDYTIHVTGLEDEEQATAIEQALNRGDNGKNLYNHLKLTTPNGENLGVDYANGHLAAVDTQQELDDRTLDEVKKQAGPIWARYSSTYNPHQEAMNEKILSLDPDSPLNTQESKDRMSAAVRVGAPEIIAEFRARQQDMRLVINQNRDVDPDGSIALKTYMRAYAQPAVNARKTIEGYYAEAHAENSSYPFLEGLEHIAQKYKRPDSGIFRSDLTEAQRDMAYRQERALLTGARLTLFDPYALASIGGVQTAQTSHQGAMQAVIEKMNELRNQLYGIE
ncbi:DUF4885 domain-containing protein [Pseudoflavonifractor sp. 524-17]|uniref:DUF4885 family protein n=1 Tax=Pseudoflavonifractor sp. 524-17 TaxID=2304577 RepID=UPI00137AD662|nr:DUF4885 family protein [Pseudoflavonifractor sp. 524-17]NCE64429.1 DUF4885 domain-containing protein [Pseudoflavonifractor sp. 524-17]